jgi:tRNA1(Val) A37 N6-methylase TrmN6
VTVAGTTHDTLLGGRVQLHQPAQGYRVAIDPVLLAAAVPARRGEHVLDLGTGVGAAALCLAMRVAECRVTGVELDDELVAIARRNADANGLAERFVVAAADVRAAPGNAFDHVMANPPFAEAGRGTASPSAARQRANVEGEAGLAAWVDAAFAAARAGGSVTIIHRADRVAELLQAFARAGAGGSVLYPLWPKAGADAKRVLVQGTKGSRAPARVGAGLVLHEAEGAYSRAAQAVLREGAALRL